MGQYEIYTLFIACFFHIIVWFIVLKVVDVVKDGGSVKEGFSFLTVQKPRQLLNFDVPHVLNIVCSEIKKNTRSCTKTGKMWI